MRVQTLQRTWVYKDGGCVCSARCLASRPDHESTPFSDMPSACVQSSPMPRSHKIRRVRAKPTSQPDEYTLRLAKRIKQLKIDPHVANILKPLLRPDSSSTIEISAAVAELKKRIPDITEDTLQRYLLVAWLFTEHDFSLRVDAVNGVKLCV